MKQKALELLKKIEDNGFEAYIVGGFVRDYCLGKESIDIDICTNATPKQLNDIFDEAIVPIEKYGSVTLEYKKVRYEITTYRKETKYNDYRRPDSVEYVNSLIDDLNRRDFTINTICMNSSGEVIDMLNGLEDLRAGIIRTVGDPDIRLKEDVLRILRAIRFATALNFSIADDVKKAITNNSQLLKNLSYTRKKDELTKIFTSHNVLYGVKLMREFDLDKCLELSNLDNLKVVDDILGIWAQLDILNIYPFNNIEKEIISKIEEILSYGEIDKYILYKYGLYITGIAASIKGIDKKELTKMYNDLPIQSRRDINFDVSELCKELNITPSYWVKDIYNDLEKEIIDGNIANEKESIFKYVSDNLNDKIDI